MRRLFWALTLVVHAGCSDAPVVPPVLTGQDAEAPAALDGGAPDASEADAGEVSGSEPTAVIMADPTDGVAPIEVRFDGAQSTDPDGDIAAHRWDFGDGSSGEGAQVTHRYAAPGTFRVVLTVTDARGASATAEINVRVTLPACPSFARGSSRGILGANVPDLLDEVSGLAASRRANDLLWVHNDSGDGPRIYAIDDHGAVRAGYELVGAQAVDWEDIALGPGPNAGVTYIYVGDIGDNERGSDVALVYRVPEPASVPPATAMPSLFRLRNVETFVLEYGGGRAFNAETMLVDPRNGDLYIVSKSDRGRSRVFRAPAPLAAGAQTRLEDLGDLDVMGEATGGDISPSGEIVIRTYESALLWRRPEGLSVQDALRQAPCVVRLAREPQGEAIAFTHDGGGLWTTTEGSGAFLYFYGRE